MPVLTNLPFMVRYLTTNGKVDNRKKVYVRPEVSKGEREWAWVSAMKVEIENKVVARFRDGKIIKGFTQDFFPNKDVFHISTTERGKDLTEVLVPDLKALFFVKSFEGKKDHRKHDHPDVIQKLSKTAGIKLKIVFADGEQMLALTQGYDPSRKGFFIFSPDTESNWERAFVLKQAIKEVTRVK